HSSNTNKPHSSKAANFTLYFGQASGLTNSSGFFTTKLPASPTNYSIASIFVNAYASIGGLGDHGIYTTGNASEPLLMISIIPNGTNNNILFIDPHAIAQNSGSSNNCFNLYVPSSEKGKSTSLGLRITAVYKSTYGYVFEVLNFTLNPGEGNQPSSCTAPSKNGIISSFCYWNLPQAPLFLFAFVERNSNGNNLPKSQVLIIPYGESPEYYLSNRVIVFGRSINGAPAGSASSIAFVGDSAYQVSLYLYYDGNAFSSLG
ncbi:MAG: hypothetical protein ACP5NY_09445, partial [Thermocladium sp.]